MEHTISKCDKRIPKETQQLLGKRTNVLRKTVKANTGYLEINVSISCNNVTQKIIQSLMKFENIVELDV